MISFLQKLVMMMTMVVMMIMTKASDDDDNGSGDDDDKGWWWWCRHNMHLLDRCVMHVGPGAERNSKLQTFSLFIQLISIDRSYNCFQFTYHSIYHSSVL